MNYGKSIFIFLFIIAAGLVTLFYATGLDRDTAAKASHVFSISMAQIEKALDRAAAHEMDGSHARHLMSVHIDVDPSFKMSWRHVESFHGKHSWHLTLYAADAAFIRPHFARTDYNRQSIFVYGPDAEVLPDSLRTDDRREAGGWWGPLVSGELLFVEVHSDDDEPPSLVVDKISYGLKLYHDDEKEQGCHLDVNCHQEWENIKNGVAMMHFESGEFGFKCTGSLLRDSYSTRRPWFLTANHCIDNQAEAESLIVYWEFETVECNGPSRALVALETNEGADYIAGSVVSDYTLLMLHDDPPFGTPFLEFTLDDLEPDEQIAVIHHPAGTYKRITFGHSTGDIQNFWTVVYNQGSTEDGSSGSPLFNSRQQIVGQLSSGNASCWWMFGKDEHGKMSSSWLLGLEEYLLSQTTTSSTTTTTIPSGEGDDDDMDYTDDDDSTEEQIDRTLDEQDDGGGCGC